MLAGGQNEAIAAHKEAMHAVFDLGKKWHRHEQPYRGSTDGTTKWAMLEMWRMTVSSLGLAYIRSHLETPRTECAMLKMWRMSVSG